MRIIRLLVLPVLLFAMLGCGLASGIQQIQEAATQLPGMLTAAPSALAPMQTAAAKYTPSAGGEAISLDNTKLVLQMSQQLKFSDETVDGQATAVARLTDTGKSIFTKMGDGFSAAFFSADSSNVSKIRIIAPRSDSDDDRSVQEAIGLISIVLAGSLPAEVNADSVPWLNENYAKLSVSEKVETTLSGYLFVLQRTDTDMILNVSPSK